MLIRYFALLLFAFFTYIQSYLIGVDIGSEFFKVCVIKPGKPFSMMENLQGKTKTPNAISMKDDEIAYDAEALAKKARFPKNVFTFFKSYLGEKYDSLFVREFLSEFLISYDIEEDPQRHSITFNIQFNNELEKISLEEIYGMLFNHIKFLAEKYAKITITDCFVTIPSFFNYKQRNALAQGIKISKLDLQGFVSDNIAVAVNFQLKKVFEKKEYYILYNMGSSSTQVSLVSFETLYETNDNKTVDIGNEIQILGEASNRKLGGNYFNKQLIKILMKKFDELPERKGKNSVMNNKKVYEKLIPSAIKYKEILSANKESHVAILNIDSGMNYEGKVSRQEFYEACQPLLTQVYEPIEQLLNKTGLTLENITQIELLGGEIRIPKIQKMIKERLGNYSNILGAHMNGDDSMAFGAAFMAANSSGKIKRSRKIFMINGANSEIKLYLRNFNVSESLRCNGGKNADKEAPLTNACLYSMNKNTTLIRLRHGYDIKRTVSFYHDSNIEIEVKEKMENEDEEQLLMTYRIMGIDDLKREILDLNITKLPHITLHFTFSKIGELTMYAEGIYNSTLYYGLSAGFNDTLTYKYSVNYTSPLPQSDIDEIDAKIKELNDTINQNDTMFSANETITPESNETITPESNETMRSSSTKEESENSSNIKNSTNATDSNNTSKVNDSLFAILKEMKDKARRELKELLKRKKIGTSKIKENKIRLKLEINHSSPMPLTQDQILESKKKIQRYEDIDNNRIKVIEVKNSLESTIYSTKNFLESEHAKLFGKEDELKATEELNSRIHNWYEEEGYAANYTVLNQQLRNLSYEMDKYHNRLRLVEEREKAVNQFMKVMNETYGRAARLIKMKPWVEEHFNKTFKNDVDAVINWFNESITLQKDLKYYEETNFTSSAIQSKIDIIRRAYREMEKVPKPKEDTMPKDIFKEGETIEDLIVS